MLKVCLCIMLSSVTISEARDRVYYLSAEPVEWDYAPGGLNVVDNRQDDADVFLKRGRDRIGRVYTKCVYKSYTDQNYTVEVPKPGWMGILGPTLRAEVGDKMIVYFRNRCFREFSVHPHGVKYDKDMEGALYLDGTFGSDKRDDMIPPGGNYKYVWEIPVNFAPAPDDPACVSWVYHSHVDASKDSNTGLIGHLLTCKNGTLNDDNTRKDGQKDYAVLFKVFNEGISWYQEQNFQKCGHPAACATLADEGDKDFEESNLMHTINGVLYGNLPAFEGCQNEQIIWHMIGMGTDVDIHTVFIHGQTMEYNKYRRGSVHVFAAELKTVITTPQEPGRWLINCQVNYHYIAGMQAYFDVRQCGANPAKSSSNYRVYYIAAEEVLWDYGPSGHDRFYGGLLTDTGKDSKVYYEKDSNRIGGVYKKALFFEYTDRSFTQRNTRSASEMHLGFLGPVIRAEEGETIIVVFYNKASRPYSIEAHGVQISKAEEGAKYNDNTTGAASVDDEVPPGGVFVYFWRVSQNAAPTTLDEDCVTNFYQSGVHPVRDTSSGLIGPLLVCKKGSLTAENKQKNVEQEFVLMFATTDENLSWYIDENMKRLVGNKTSVDREDEDFLESNKMRNINGRGYGNLNGLYTSVGCKVSWHLIGLGSESDMQTVNFHGNTLIKDGGRVDTIAVFPGTTATALMVPDNPGVWGVVSRTNLNFVGGMTALYHVRSTENNITLPLKMSAGATRTYYIAAYETQWDFAPRKTGAIVGKSLYDEDSPGYIFVRNDTGFIGSTYKKVLYRQFNDSTFQFEIERGEKDRHLDMLGPIIRAEVGDKINVVFHNKASRPYSLHPHGIITDKGNEGALYGENIVPGPDDSVPGGSTFNYQWHVTEKAGPAAGDPNCIAWPYYSHVNPVRDVQSGLIGPIVICRKGTLDADGQRKDGVDRELALLFTVTDENESWYIKENLQSSAPNRNITDDPDFVQSNLMHGINGRIYGNNMGLEINNGDVVAWYILAMGTDIDVHTVHFHGQTILHEQQVVNRLDVVEVFPGISSTLEMRADHPGTWLLHCHITDHIDAGMETVYTIRDSEDDSLPATTRTTPTVNNQLPSICVSPAAWKETRDVYPKRTSLLWNLVCNRVPNTSESQQSSWVLPKS